MRPEPVIKVRLPIKHACTGYAQKFWSCAEDARLIKKRLRQPQVISGRFRSHMFRPTWLVSGAGCLKM